MLNLKILAEPIDASAEIDRLRALVVRPISLADILGLDPAQERIVRAMLACHPTIMSRDDIYFWSRGLRTYQTNVVDVQISRIREKLRGHGMAIRTHRCTPRDSGGYTLSDDTAKRLFRMVGAGA